MNHIHRIVWNDRSGTYVAVAETTPGRSKRAGGAGALLAAVLLGTALGTARAQTAPPPFTLPTGGQVAAGQASLNTSGNRLDIQQASQRAIINWQSFSIGADAQVNFLQPGAGAVTLNRVLGSDPSNIFGRLSANGQVFLVNPNGVMFGNTARVDVGGLAASSMQLVDADFMAGRYRFTAGNGSVVNHGELSARDGGYIALLAPEVRNSGVISATLGTVALAAGQAATLQTEGPFSVAVEQGALDALVENKHIVRADDGRVLISARSSNALQRAVIRNDGSIEAKGVRNIGGVIRLEADVVAQTGSIDVSSRVADGGQVDVRALASDGGGNLVVGGRVDATGERGGSVMMTGNTVELVAAQIDASGVRAGGQVLIGGGVQGLDAQVPNAQRSSLDAGTRLRADSLQSGDGGKLVVWADQHTRVAGRLSARGGASGGNGGFVETSGKQTLSIAGASVDASAPRGANGQWLLDPSNATITHGSANSLTGGLFDPPTNSSIGDTEINAALNGGTDVTIQTSAGTGGSGAIVVNGSSDAGGAVAISNTSGGARSLTLITAGTIDIRSGASIGGTSGHPLDVNLNATGGSTIAGTLDNRGGTTALTGATMLSGTIKNGTVLSLNPTPSLTSNYGKLDGVTLGGTSLTVSGELHIYNDLTLADGLTVSVGGNNWYFNGQDTGQAAGTVHRLTTAGTATLNMAGSNLNIYAVNGQTLQIDAGVTVQGHGNLQQTWSGSTITNNGSVIANTAGQTLAVTTTTFTNTGAVTATAGTLTMAPTTFTNNGTANASGGTLNLNGTSWSNAGTINVNSGILNLGGVFTVADLTGARYSRSGGSVNITGRLDNNATSVDIGGTGLFGSGGLTLLTGTIQNGTVTSGDATPLRTNYGKLDNVTLGGTSFSVTGELFIYNDLTLANGLTVNASANNWYFNGQDTGQAGGTIHHLATPGSATLNLAGTNLTVYAVNGQTLQIDAGMTVQGYGSLNQVWSSTATNEGSLIANTAGQTLNVSTTAFTNNGTVTATAGTLTMAPVTFTNNGDANANGGTLNIDGMSWSNAGTINANSGVLNLGGVFTVADLTGARYSRSGGSVNITGRLDNTATSVDIGGTGLFGSGGLTLLTGTIQNGTVTSGDATPLRTNYGKLDNVTLGGTSFSVTGELFIYNDLTLANGLTVNASANNWYFNGQDTGQAAGTVHHLATPGSATLNLAGTNLTVYAVNGQTLQIDAGMTVQGYGSLNQVWSSTATNEGSLIANTAGQTLNVSTTSFTNNGAVTATAGTLTMAPVTFTNSGTASASGGTLNLDGTSWSNPGTINANSGVLNLGGAFAVADLTGLHYNRAGGSVNITGRLDNTATSVDIGGTGLFGSGGLTLLTGTIQNGTVTSGDATPLRTNYGKLDNVTLGGTSFSVTGELFIYNDLTLANGLTVNASANNWYFNGQDTGQAAGTIHHLATPGSATFNLAGTNLTVYAVNGQTLQIDAGMTVQGYGSLNQVWSSTVTNEGSLIANTAGQALNVASTAFTQSGTIHVASGATFSRGAGFVNNGTLSGSGTIAVGTGASKLVNRGDIVPGGTGSTGTLTVSGDLQLSSGTRLSIELGGASAGQFDKLAVSGAVSGNAGSFGTLAVSKINGYTYSNVNGDSFALLTGASGVSSGSFAPFTLARSNLTPSYAATGFSLLAAPMVLTVNANSLSKVYGAADPTLIFAASGFDPATADDASTALSGLLARASGKNVGAYGINRGTLTSPLGYAISLTAGSTLSITPAPLSLTANNASKTYDGGLAATTTAAISSGTLFSGDTLSGGSFAYTDKNAGIGTKTVTTAGVTVGDGVNNGNYSVSYVDNTTSTINPFAVSAIGSRVYDATANVAASSLTLGALVGGETLTLSGTGTLADKHVGTHKPVSLGSLVLGTGTGLASNYSLAGSSIAYDVVAKNLAVTGVSAANRIYDATVVAGLTGTAVVSGLSGDDVSVGGTGAGSFANKNVGTNKAVTVTGFTLSGADAANYAVVQPAGLTANVTQANLSITGIAASNRIYNATTVAGLTGTAAVTALLSDDVSVAGTGVGSFANKSVGTSKAVTVTGYTLGGVDALNYAIIQPAGLVANVTQASLSVTGIAASSRVYDATTVAGLTGTAAVTPLLSDDVAVGGTGAASFANKNVGTNKAVTVTGYTLSGADALNYAVVQPVGLTANVAQANLSVTGIAASSKVYDATTVAGLTGTPAVSALMSDDVSVGGTGVGNFSNKNVGTNQAVTVTGYALSGADALNYAVVQPAGLTANVTQATLSVTGVAASSRVYDATAVAGLTGTAAVSALLSDDVVAGGVGVGSFANKNVGKNKAVTVTGYTLSGADAMNYAVVQPAWLVADVTRANLLVTGVAASSRTYDATTVAGLTGTAMVSALMSDDVVASGIGAGSFASKNVGANKAVTVTGYTLTGADAMNYAVVQPAGLIANITQANLSIAGIEASNRVYDATTVAGLTGTAGVTPLLSDDVSVRGTGVGTFANKNVGTNKAISVSGYTLSGADALNYVVVQPAGLTANVTQANLSVTGIAASSRVYDATPVGVLTGTAAVSALLSDDVTAVGTGAGRFADKNVGANKAVTVTGYTLGGADASNYAVVQPSGLTATVTQASLSVTGISASNKVYDATRVASLTGTAAVSALSSDDVSVGGSGVGSFANKNVGSNKAVTVTGYTLSGTDALNYTAVQPTGLVADVSPALLPVTGVSAMDKTYDASRAATLIGHAVASPIDGDSVAVIGTGRAEFTSPDPGAQAVRVTGYTLAGVDAGNYSVVQPRGLQASILPMSQNNSAPAQAVQVPTLPVSPRNTAAWPLGQPAAQADAVIAVAPQGSAGAARQVGAGGLAFGPALASPAWAIAVPTTHDSVFTIVLPADAVGQTNFDPKLPLDAVAQDGSHLPDWLKFDPTTRTFSGTVPSQVQALRVLLVGKDENGKETVVAVNLNFDLTPGIRIP